MNNRPLKAILTFLVMIVLVLPAIVPFFSDGFFTMHDTTHVSRLSELSRTLNDGHFPAIWSRNLGFGYGMPIFGFYASLPYYLGYLFTLVGFSVINAIKLVFVLTFFGSFLGMYLLSKEYWGKLGGLLSAVSFIYLPYRALNVYVRGALGELVGMTFLIFALWIMTKMRTDSNKKMVLWLGIFVGAVLLSHNLMSLMGIPVLVIYGVYIVLSAEHRRRWHRLKNLAFGLLIGGLLSAFFVIPTLFEKSYTFIFSGIRK